MHELKIEEIIHEMIKPNDIVSIGTSDLELAFIKKLAFKIEDEEIKIKFIPSSIKQAELIHSYGLALTNLNDDLVDVSFEFASYCDRWLNYSKQNFHSLIADKMIARCSKRHVVFCLAKNAVENLNEKPVSFEVARFGYERTLLELMNLGKANFRKQGKNFFLSDSGNYVIDVKLMENFSLDDIDFLAKKIPGVLETSLFHELADEIVLYDKIGGIDTFRIKR